MLGRLREHEPVSWVPVLDGWLVTRRDLCLAVMRDAETFTVDDPRFSTQQVIGPSMLSLDGAEHRRHRQPFGDPFRAETVREKLAAWVDGRAAELVSTISQRGAGDLRAELAAPLAVEVMARLLALDGVKTDEVLGWYEAIVDAVHAVTMGDDVPASGLAAFDELHGAVTANLDSSPLLSAVHDSGDLSNDEIVSNVAVLLFGGIVTSESTTALALHFLLADPGLLDRVRADDALVARVVDETLRLEPSAAVVDRYATHRVELGEASIEKGELVRVSLAAANRDPTVFTDPDRLDTGRPNGQQHLAFARGPHVCLGIHVARLEAAVAAEAALTGLPGLRPDPEGMDPPRGLVFRAPEHVRARWDVNHLPSGADDRVTH